MKRILLTVLLTMTAVLTTTGHMMIEPNGAALRADAGRQILKVDEAFRIAKLKNDTTALGRILVNEFYEINQNGNGRDKEQFIELFDSFRIMSLTTNDTQVRVTGDTATVTGSQTETNATGIERMLFTRVYVRAGEHWRLLASTQFRNPKA